MAPKPQRNRFAKAALPGWLSLAEASLFAPGFSGGESIVGRQFVEPRLMSYDL
jgi:hypothetical protein